MRRTKIEAVSYDLYLRRMKLFQLKNEDYAGMDALANFKRLAEICKVWGVDVSRPSGCAEYLAILKLDRYFNLRRQGKSPQNESIQDTFMDLANYLDLLHAILTEDTILTPLEDIE